MYMYYANMFCHLIVVLTDLLPFDSISRTVFVLKISASKAFMKSILTFCNLYFLYQGGASGMTDRTTYGWVKCTIMKINQK